MYLLMVLQWGVMRSNVHLQPATQSPRPAEDAQYRQLDRQCEVFHSVADLPLIGIRGG